MARYSIGRKLRRRIHGIWLDLVDYRGERAADKALGRIVEVFSLIAQQPGIGVGGSKDGIPVRRFLAGDYWIYYRLGRRGVQFTSVKHHRERQSADWDAREG